MKNVEYKIEGKKGEEVLTIKVKLSERHGLSNSGNTINVGGTGGNQKIGLGDIAFGLSVYTKEGLAAARLVHAKEAGYKTWEEFDQAKKGTTKTAA
jgi:hypothetical protein